jgi:hypothetical protein
MSQPKSKKVSGTECSEDKIKIIEGDEDDLEKFDMVSREMFQTFVAYNLGDTKIGDSNNANPS